MVQAIVFDLFDTLVDLHMERIQRVEVAGLWVGGTSRALFEALRDHDEALDFEHFARTLHRVDAEFRQSRYAKGLELPTLERFETLLGRLALEVPGLAQVLTDVHMAGLRAQVRLVDHHGPLLARLRKRARLALCSNFSHSATAISILEEAGLREHLDVVVVSDEIGIRKPRPEIFHATLEALGVGPEEALHVGDNLSADVGGAAALGIRTAWITRRISEPEELLARHDGPSPDHRIADLAELEMLLD